MFLQTPRAWTNRIAWDACANRSTETSKTTSATGNTKLAAVSRNCCSRCPRCSQSRGKWSSKSNSRNYSEWRTSNHSCRRCYSEVSAAASTIFTDVDRSKNPSFFACKMHLVVVKTKQTHISFLKHNCCVSKYLVQL